MRSHAAAGKRRGGRKANAKGDAKNGKLFHVETPSQSCSQNNEVGLVLVFRSNKSLYGATAGRPNNQAVLGRPNSPQTAKLEK
jgi:hypothetical protein